MPQHQHDLGAKTVDADQVEVCAKAGYQGIEPWIRDLRQYVESGSKLSELRKRIDDAGLKVESAIALHGGL